MRDQKHCFAIYCGVLKKNNILKICDLQIVERVTKILRLQVGDQLTLFNQQLVASGTLDFIDKKSFNLVNIVWQENVDLKPEISVSLGVLKKENFENALYSCVELGANQIAPIIFAKSVPLKLNSYRIQKILVAASEQSKNFKMPVFQEPVLFDKFLSQIKKNPETVYLHCDVNGLDMFNFVASIKEQKTQQLVLIIGPEGDLTGPEKELLLAQPNVIFMRLTPTVLRSFQAVTVALGALRSLLP